MLKKGLALEYMFLLAVFGVVVFVGTMLVKHFHEQADEPIDIDIDSDFTYMCTQLNDTVITFQDFQDILYGFMSDQCYEFYGTTKQKITIDDIKRVVNSVDESYQVIEIKECKLPEVNSGNIYLTFSEVSSNSNLYLRRKKTNNSDILICD